MQIPLVIFIFKKILKFIRQLSFQLYILYPFNKLIQTYSRNGFLLAIAFLICPFFSRLKYSLSAYCLNLAVKLLRKNALISLFIVFESFITMNKNSTSSITRTFSFVRMNKIQTNEDNHQNSKKYSTHYSNIIIKMKQTQRLALVVKHIRNVR